MGSPGQVRTQETPSRPRVDRGAQGGSFATQPLLGDQNAEARCSSYCTIVAVAAIICLLLLKSMSGVRQNVGLMSDNIKNMKTSKQSE